MGLAAGRGHSPGEEGTHVKLAVCFWRHTEVMNAEGTPGLWLCCWLLALLPLRGLLAQGSWAHGP